MRSGPVAQFMPTMSQSSDSRTGSAADSSEPSSMVPVVSQVTIETTGTMLLGSELSAALPVLESLDCDIVGMNCATGPDLMQEHARYLGKTASRFVSVLPNAGLRRNVGGVATYDLTPDELARY